MATRELVGSIGFGEKEDGVTRIQFSYSKERIGIVTTTDEMVVRIEMAADIASELAKNLLIAYFCLESQKEQSVSLERANKLKSERRVEIERQYFCDRQIKAGNKVVVGGVASTPENSIISIEFPPGCSEIGIEEDEIEHYYGLYMNEATGIELAFLLLQVFGKLAALSMIAKRLELPQSRKET